MIKRSLYFAQPAYLSTKHEQLVVNYPNKDMPCRTVPIEDIAIVLLENAQITITNALIAKLCQRGVALISCNQQHMPDGLMLPLDGHSEQSERFRTQIAASVPLRKNLWQQTVSAKIRNQAALLASHGFPYKNMLHWAKTVTSGDSNNLEARAAAHYWSALSPQIGFRRMREGMAPNNLLNYGYAILRAITARALVCSGMTPCYGIFHRNKYNAYCLADDIMEPYRPYVDLIALSIFESYDDIEELTVDMKKELLGIATIDVYIDNKRSPLMVAMSRTTNSLYECFEGTARKILYPDYDGG